MPPTYPDNSLQAAVAEFFANNVSYDPDGSLRLKSAASVRIADQSGVAAPTTSPVVASVTLTSAQVLAIFTTPVTIVPAPGAGLAIVPLEVVYNYQFKTTPYTDGGGLLHLLIGSVAASNLTTAGFWDQGASRILWQSANIANAAESNVVNQAVTVRQNTANPTLGDGLLMVSVAYITIPIA